MYLASLSATWIVMSSSHSLEGLFHSTPLGFREVVQHVRLHVAAMSEFVNSRKDGRYEGRKSSHSLEGIENAIGPLQSSGKVTKLLLEGTINLAWSHKRGRISHGIALHLPVRAILMPVSGPCLDS